MKTTPSATSLPSRRILTKACALLACGLVLYWTIHNQFGGYYWGTPSSKMLIGAWRISGASLEKLRRSGYAKAAPDDHQLLLRSDGSCHFKSYRMYVAPDLADQKWVEGTWRVVSARRLSGLLSAIGARGSILTLDLQEQPNSSYSVQLYFAREGHQFELWNFLGDPDDKDAVAFIRCETKQSP